MANEKVSIGHVDSLTDASRSAWAEELLAGELTRQGMSVVPVDQADLRIVQLDPGDERVSELRQRWQDAFGASLADSPESFVMGQDDSTILIAAADQRGYGYALTELYDIVRYSADPVTELRSLRTYLEHPANPARSITRLFTSEAIDKGWFYDRSVLGRLPHRTCRPALQPLQSWPRRRVRLPDRP